MNASFIARFCRLICLVSSVALLAPGIGCHKERPSEPSSSPVNQAIQLKPIKSEMLSPAEAPQTVTCEGQIKVTVPGGLLRSPATLTISAVSNPPQSPGPGIQVLAAFDVSLGDLRQLPGELEIELPVPVEILRTDCPPEAALCAGYYDAADQSWVELPVTLSTDRKSMMIRTQHLCILESWYVGLNYTFLPGRDFGVFYDKDAVAEATKDYFPKYPDPKMPGYVSDIYEFAKQARDAYGKYELKPYSQPLWILVMPDSSNPVYTWHLQRLFMSCGSSNPKVLQYAVSHEMFHAIQHAGYMRKQAAHLDHKWWLEATAEYASSRLAMQHYGMMGKIDEQVMPPRMLTNQLLFFGKKKDNTNITGSGYHQYQMAHFLEFICKQMRPEDLPGFFAKMYKDVVRRTVEGEGWIESAPSAVDSLDAFLIACNNDTSLDDMFRKFTVFYLLSPDSPMNMKDAPPGQVNPQAVEYTYTLKASQKATPVGVTMSGRHTASMMLVNVEMREGKASREVAVELADRKLPPRTALFVCKLPGKERARMEMVGAFTKPEQAKDSIPVTLGADDQIALLAVNDHSLTQTVRAVVKSATTTIRGTYAGDLILKYVNEEEYINAGMESGTDDSTLNKNENHKEGNKKRLELLKNRFNRKEGNKVRIDISFFSDAETRVKSGAKPDVSITSNSLVTGTVVGEGGYINSQDRRNITKCDVTGNAMEIVKSAQIRERGGIVNYMYTFKASISGNKMTGTWATTRNGNDLFKGTFIANKTVSEDGTIINVK